MVQVTATKQTISNAAVALGNYIGICTGSPGTTATPSNEAAGGSPAYARQATTWTAGSGGVNNGSPVTINLPSSTYLYLIQCSGSSGNNMVDWCPITAVVLSSQTAIPFTPVYTVT